MKIAVEGCAHGELDKIYECIDHLQKENSIKVDLLIICGDFQAVRNRADMQCMAVPAKYRKLNTFYKYYSGEKKAPILTIFVGGNHEASNYLSELPYGGWVCPNIYYLGYANVINIGGIRIAGLSGIYKGQDYLKGHFECLPYDESSKKSVYHVRNLDVFRLKQIKEPIDIFISHDWPAGVYNFGNKDDLLRWKPYFREEMHTNSLGSKPAEELMMKLKPSFYFAAHLHCKFAAMVPHSVNGGKIFTKFLALDKCLPQRKFLQVVDIENSSHVSDIKYDVEWLSILHLTNHLLSVSRSNNYMPGNGCSERWNFTPSADEIKAVHQMFEGNLKIPNNFAVTAPCYDPSNQNSKHVSLKPYVNPQTVRFCEILGLTDPVIKILGISNKKEKFDSSFNFDEMRLSDDSGDSVSSSSTDIDTSGCSVFFIDKIGAHLNSKSQSMPLGPLSQNFNLPKIKRLNLGCGTTTMNSEPSVKKFKL